MADGLTCEIEGLRLVERELDLLATRSDAATSRAAMHDIGLIIERRSASALREETAPEIVADVGDARNAAGQEWPPLADNTLVQRRGPRARARKGAEVDPRAINARALRDTGTGARSITSVAGDGWVEAGAGVDYMAYQHGGTGPYTIMPREAPALAFMTMDGLVVTPIVQHPGIPARPFVGINREDIDSMLEMTYRRLMRAGA